MALVQSLVAGLCVVVVSALPQTAASASTPDGPQQRTAQAVTTKPGISLARATGEVVQVGAAVQFTGTAPKKVRGLRLVLQRRDSAKSPWLKVGTTKVSSTGAFTVAGKAGRVGTNAWRAVATHVKKSHQKSKRPKKTVFTSSAVNTTVYGWFFLTDKDWVDSFDQGGSYPDTGNMTVGGISYPRSVSFGSYTTSWDWEFPAWAEYNLSYRCLQLTASLGISDGSETGTNATFFVSVDGARAEVGTKGLGPASPIAVDVTNALRIRLEGIPNSRNLYGFGGFGDAQVLCNKAP